MKSYGCLLASCVVFVNFAVSLAVADDSDKTSEVLHVPAYPGIPPWKQLSNQHNSKQLMIEWIPIDQDESHIRDILTEQAFYGLRNEPPSGILNRMMSLTMKACRDVRVNGPFDRTEESYAVAYAQIYCTGEKNADVDVDILLKSITGKDAVYVIQREFRRPSKPGAVAGVMEFSKNEQQQLTQKLEAMKVANQFLKDSVFLCPMSGGSERCADTQH